MSVGDDLAQCVLNQDLLGDDIPRDSAAGLVAATGLAAGLLPQLREALRSDTVASASS